MSSKTKNYVFTHNPPETATKGGEYVNEPIAEFAGRLRAQPGKDIWIMGGGGLIASFVDAGAVDDFIIHVIPTFIGEGTAHRARPAHRPVEAAVDARLRRRRGSAALLDGVTPRTSAVAFDMMHRCERW